jgi:hypothetical protein
MKIFIPEIGTKLTLMQPWSFTLYDERRNRAVVDLIAKSRPDELSRIEAQEAQLREQLAELQYKKCPTKESFLEKEELVNKLKQRLLKIRQFPVLLPAGTELTVDRLYVRKGISDYSSMTFYLTKTDYPALNVRGKKRFWAKLEDVNTLEVRIRD